MNPLEIFLNNCQLSRNVSSLKNWHLSFITYLIVCQASCHFAAVEADAKSVTGSFAAWNNRTSSAYSDVSDQVFPGCLVRRLSNKSPSDRRLVPTNRYRTRGSIDSQK